jgi:hypothetical protein
MPNAGMASRTHFRICTCRMTCRITALSLLFETLSLIESFYLGKCTDHELSVSDTSSLYRTCP